MYLDAINVLNFPSPLSTANKSNDLIDYVSLIKRFVILFELNLLIFNVFRLHRYLNSPSGMDIRALLPLISKLRSEVMSLKVSLDK